MSNAMTPACAAPPEPALRIDLGCGGKKRSGFVGLDVAPFAGVDHVVDVEHGRLPFDDDTVGEIYSSHFFEHMAHPRNAVNELVRVARAGAPFQVWTPFIRCNHALLPTHLSHLERDPLGARQHDPPGLVVRTRGRRPEGRSVPLRAPRGSSGAWPASPSPSRSSTGSTS